MITALIVNAVLLLLTGFVAGSCFTATFLRN